MAEPRPRTTSEKTSPEKAAPLVEQKEQPKQENRQAKTSPEKAVPRVERKEQPKQESKQTKRNTKGSPGRIQRLRNGRVGRFITEAYYELRHKVTWPTFEEARNMTIAVILISAAIGGVLGLVDFGLYHLFLYISR